MPSKILIANRGEIAVRVMRTCRELGIPTVAVYSDLDRDALARPLRRRGLRARRADRGRELPQHRGDPRAIERSGADAVHPGYGFFSENADFARAITRRGVTWIGPPPEAIEVMGDKISSRKAAAAADVAVGARHARADPVDADEVVAFGERVRLAGRDQGRVRRRRQGPEGRARAPTRRPRRFESAAREAVAYFGRPEAYLERYLTRPRHIEIQVFADTHGNVGVARRARLLDPAPPPEADRGEPGGRPRRRRPAPRWARPR